MNEVIAKRLALSMALMCVRNTCIEDIHAGVEPSSKGGDFSDVKVVTPYGEIPWNKLSRVRDDEMREFMKQVVDRLYTVLLRLEGMSRGLLNLAGRALPVGDVMRPGGSPQGHLEL
jgi:hypothetical protein